MTGHFSVIVPPVGAMQVVVGTLFPLSFFLVRSLLLFEFPFFTGKVYNLYPQNLDNDVMGNLIGSRSLANDVSITLDTIKVISIQDAMRININQVSNCKIRHPPTEESEDEYISTTCAL